jgi:hypothetical protein
MRPSRIRRIAAMSTRPARDWEISTSAPAKDIFPRTTHGRRVFHSARYARSSRPRLAGREDARVGCSPDSLMSVSYRSKSTAAIMKVSATWPRLASVLRVSRAHVPARPRPTGRMPRGNSALANSTMRRNWCHGNDGATRSHARWDIRGGRYVRVAEDYARSVSSARRTRVARPGRRPSSPHTYGPTSRRTLYS